MIICLGHLSRKEKIEVAQLHTEINVIGRKRINQREDEILENLYQKVITTINN
jgi:hypothetical protein